MNNQVVGVGAQLGGTELTVTIRQRSSGRFLDAHESGNDFSAVTRLAQNNDIQRWVIPELIFPVG